MKVKIKYFASIREALGVGEESLETAASTVGGLRDELIARGGVHAQALARTQDGKNRAVRAALDQRMSGEEAALREGCEVAFFPPVTGG
ncbi:molybdenum cofactor biosynthesis protein MoaD [Hylemonella gracilis str. Niagara R]|uniref:Molybdopterin synthase sulfur carrier subunit n=1 Tax=Hylemonella gracilis str. Niagara R TaxID=1458275 RepID=A0A016XI22_9BURK|nr:MoaD/ThiS family protein [Hylemonella gracilis]EYC51754.1 molybdenum cofactor biosynthesis protein MoaD [Hylemonella gracilis str. Niagara R]